jgi:glycosyltransferase involved in cell wall biosynthesis
MSGYARDAQLSLLEHGSATADALAERLCVLHPPQHPLISAYEEKVLPGDMLTCTFVGRDFFRKGGKEIIAAFSQLRSEGEEIRLRVISSLGWGDYVTRSTAGDAEAARAFLRQGSPYVLFESELPNADVLIALRDSHIALLPTYDDTYGFSILEAQAAATPVITTNVCALPEINSDSTGWMIRVPLDAHRQILLASEDDRKRATDLITEGIYNALKAALREPSIIHTRGLNALGRIRAEHSPEGYAAALGALYHEALHSRT